MKEKRIIASDKVLIGCMFRAEKYKADGRITYRGPWFRNTILDVGLDLLFDHSPNDVSKYINVGTDNTAPTTSQSGLLSFLAGTDNLYGSVSNTGQATDPAHNTLTKTFEFAIGGCTGNLTELGLSNSVDTDYFNRQLFKDETDSPTTVTVLSDEGLRVTASLTLYSDMQTGETAAGTFTLDGSSTGYTRGMATSPFADTDYGSTYADTPAKQFTGNNMLSAIDSETSVATDDFPGTQADQVTISAYGTGNYYADAEFVWNAGTYVGDINRIMLGLDTGGSGRSVLSSFLLDSTISLTDVQRLTLNFRRSWGRYAA
jgi:hypothetical protein